MNRWIVEPAGMMIEPVPAIEIYCDGIGAIERNDHGTICVHFVREQLPLEGGPVQRIVVARMFRPLAKVPLAIGQFAQCLTTFQDFGPDPPEERWPRLVK